MASASESEGSEKKVVSNDVFLEDALAFEAVGEYGVVDALKGVADDGGTLLDQVELLEEGAFPVMFLEALPVDTRFDERVEIGARGAGIDRRHGPPESAGRLVPVESLAVKSFIASSIRGPHRRERESGQHTQPTAAAAPVRSVPCPMRRPLSDARSVFPHPPPTDSGPNQLALSGGRGASCSRI